MTIYNADGSILLDVLVDDNSYRTRSIMGDNNIVLYYALAEHVEIPVGAYCEFQGETYTLMRPEAFKMRHSRNFEYTVTMESAEGWSKVWKFRNMEDHRLKFPYTAKPHEHLEMLVRNLNARDSSTPQWSIGTCIDGDEVYISYDHAYCYEAIGQMADTFDCEFEFDCKDKTVSLWKIEHNKENPLPLSYGKGNGFQPNVGRANYGDTPPIDILYVQGGTDNIDSSKYRGWDGAASSYLLLPAGQPTLGYDGEHFDYEEGFDEATAKNYVVSDDRYSIYQVGKDISNPTEDSLDCSEIYPKRVGTISDVITVNVDDHFYDFVDDSIPEDLDYNNYLIDGETMTVIFQSGMLAGKEFEISKYDHANRRFEIVPQEIDGITMPDPDTYYMPEVGNTYAIFHCTLPDEYIRNDETHEGAEWDIFRAAVQYMYENEDQKFTFSGELDGIWSKKDWTNIGGRIILGGYVLFTDERFEPDGAMLRIISVKDYVNKPYSPTIELSNGMVTPSFSTTMRQLESQDVLIEDNYQSSVQFTKRRFRDAQETITMLEQAFDNYSESITPIAVQTMSMLVGDESLQFRFVNSKTNPSVVAHSITYNSDTKVLHADAGIIQHMTLGINSISSSHEVSEYSFWDVSEYNSAPLDDENQAYYLYIKASKTDSSAEFYLSETALSMDGEEECYNFLCGILNSEYNDERSFVTMYGYTEILPGRITTDRIVSGDGESFWDMVADAFKLGDRLRFNVNGDGQLVLQGTMVQSTGSSDVSYIGCYRGEWDESYTYFNGDEVVYTSANGLTSTYRCIVDSVTGIEPTNSSYWQVMAAGSTGNYYEIRYATNGSATDAPSLSTNSRNPSGWSTTMPTVSDGYYLWMTMAQINGETDALVTAWSTPVRMTGEQGEAGASPVLVFCGEYDASQTYYGTDYRLDCVKYGDQYYIARIDAGTFSGRTPPNNTYWNSFGASFESIATGLLLAEWANIGGWVFKDNVLMSQIGTNSSGRVINIEDSDDFTPYITLDGVNGEIRTGNGVTITTDGVTLTDTDGNEVAKITRESIGGETSLDNAAEEADHTSTSTAETATGRYGFVGADISAITVTVVEKSVELGYFKEGDTLSSVSSQVNTNGVSISTDGITITMARLTLELYKDGVLYSSSYREATDFTYFDVQTTLGTSNLQAGVYRLYTKFEYTYQGEPTTAASTGITYYLYLYYAFHKYGIRRTLIGIDGIYSCWGNNMYFRCADNDNGGIRMRMGDYILRITETSGIQARKDGEGSATSGWTSLI